MNAELHTLVGAYALDALDEREQTAFEQHLSSCPTCTAELLEFQATAARLGDAESATPPAELRETVLSAVRRTPQQRPVVTVVPIARWRRHSSTLLAAAAAVTVLVAGGLYFAEHDRNSDLVAQQNEVEAIMTAPDREVSPAGAGDATPVTVISSETLEQAVIMVHDLPRIDEEHSYEMWAIGTDGPRSLGAMPEATEDGTQVVDYLDDAMAVAITVEPAGGSTDGKPSSAPIETVNLT